MMGDKHDHSHQIAHILTLAGVEPIAESHRQRLAFKIVVEAWRAGELGGLKSKEVLTRADAYLTQMPWLTEREQDENVKEAGPSGDYIRALVIAEREKNSTGSWKALAEKIAKENDLEFWTVYPKALAVKRASSERVGESPVEAAPVREVHVAENKKLPVEEKASKKKKLVRAKSSRSSLSSAGKARRKK
jgi:hypothetical protein